MKKILFLVFALLMGGKTFNVIADEKNADNKISGKNFVCENEVVWEYIGDGLKRQILGYDGHIMMVKLFAEKKGPVGVEHAHYHSQVTYVASGKFEFMIGGEKKVVSAGDGLYMEPDVKHSCYCIEPGIIVDCFAPMREDFLKK